jgi:hypothetical protein
MRFVLGSAVACLVFLAGCSTDRDYKLTHDRVIDAAVAGLMDEANVKRDEIKITEATEKGGRVTVITSPYKRESRVECKVNSADEHRDVPELQVRIVTNEKFYTRHKEWEWRLQEVIAAKLRAKDHGEESKPSALPMQKPQLPPVVEPKKVDLKK